MTINVNCPPRGLFIGHETENVARALTVDFSAWAAEYSTGTLQILFQPPGAERPYAVVLTRDGTTATWKPSETDLAEAGTGAVQLVYTVGEVRVKTSIIPVMVEPSLGVETDPPEGWTSWIDQLTDLAAETEQHASSAAESARNAAASAAGALQSATDAGSAKNAAVAAAEAAAASVSHYPQIVGGVWYVWSPTAGEYISTGIDAQGEDGVSPAVEITAIQGGHRVVITDADGPHTFDVLDGVTPDMSAYRTAADQDEIDDAQDEQIDDLKSALNTKANIDGTYEDLTAGNAYELLSDRGDTNAQPYLFRQTGGDSSAYNREQLKKIVGGTVAWNQLLSESTVYPLSTTIKTITPQKVVLTPNGSFSTTLHYGASLVTSALNAIPLNHVLFVCVDCESTQADKFRVRIGNSMFWSASVSANTTTRINAIGRLVTGTLTVYAYDDTLYSTTDEITFQNWNIFDLTQMFGTTIADYIYSLEQATAGAGVAFFRKLFPADYYDYNPGELMSVEGVSAHETVGFNQWDEEWEVGVVSISDGVERPASNTIRSKNYCGLIAGSTYYATCSKTDGGNQNRYYISIIFYDAEKRYISGGYFNNLTFTAPENARYFKLTTNSSTVVYGNTYNHNICVNLSDPKRNGNYEPYKKRTYPLDDSLTLRGIPKLGSNNRLYYDGDEYEPDGTVTRKYGVVDLGTLNWAKNASLNLFYTSVADAKFAGTTKGTPAKCSALANAYDMVWSGWANQPEHSISVGNNYSSGSINTTAKATEFTDAAAFKAAMSGVMLVYELATPTTETAEPYRELEICDRDGTEEFVSTSIVPVGHETFYHVNVFDYIDRLTEPDADMIADSAIAANKYFSVGNRLFLSTASIASGAQIIPGTNCTETSLAAALNALNA